MRYTSAYTSNSYGRKASYGPAVATCEVCPGTEDMQTVWDAIAGSSPTISTSGTVLPGHIAIAMYTGGPAPGNAGSWVFDAAAKTVTVTTQNIMTGEPEVIVYPVADACLPLCQETFEYWYSL